LTNDRLDVYDSSSVSNDPDANLDELIRVRREEQIASAKVVGVTDVRFLGYPDGVLQPTLDLRRDITRIIRELRPEVVATSDPTLMFTPESNYVNHPDHRAAAEAAIYATFPSAETRPIFRELLAEGLEPHRVSKLYLNFTVQPNYHVEISEVWERKTAALRCHVSQRIGDDVIEMIHEWSKRAGEDNGGGLVESFRVVTLNEDVSQD